MSNKTVILMCLMFAYEACGLFLYFITGDAYPYLPVPPGFGILLTVYWASVISDIVHYVRAEKRRKKLGIRRRKLKNTEALKKAG